MAGSELAGESVEKEAAAKELIAFMAKYNALLEAHMESIRGDMNKATIEVMDQISKVCEARGLKSKMADAVLLKRAKSGKNSEKGDFSEFSAKEIEAEEEDALSAELAKGQAGLSNNVRDAGTKLRGYMGLFQNLDSQLESMIFTIVGALSTDDVVGQRLSHVAKAINLLRDSLVEAINSFDEKLTVQGIKNFSELLERKVFDTYTMESERRTFKEVYGREPKKKK